MNKVIVGTKYDGTISICKAKPEYRGKGSCKHFEHQEIDNEKVDEHILKHNEKVLEQTYNVFGTIKRDPSRKERKRVLKLDDLWNKDEFLQEAAKEKYQYKGLDPELFNDFQELYNNAFKKNDTAEEALSQLKQYLNSSEDSLALNLKEYLDTDDVSYFIDLVSKKPNGMDAQDWSSRGKVSASRAILSRLNNDMTNDKYIATVLYFKGKCCYCDKIMDGRDRKHHPTAEHLTPVSASSKDSIRGSTRYGNMALCCSSCNARRHDTELVEWFATSQTIKKKVKPYTFNRIQGFRKFANYRDYSTKENTLINQTIEKAMSFTEQFRNPDGTKGFVKGSSDTIRPKIDKLIQELEEQVQISETERSI